MKNTKRFLALFLALMMIFVVACGPKQEADKKEPEKVEEKTDVKEEPKEDKKEDAKEEPAGDKPFEGKTLKIAGLDGGYGTEGWKKVISVFEELTGAKIEATFEKNIAEVIRPQIQAGNSPDIIYMAIGGEGGITETMIKEESVEEITDVFDKVPLGEDKPVKDKIVPGFLDTNNTNPYSDGKTYLAPLFYTPCGLFYDKAKFADGGYELPTTFDEFFELGEKAKADGTALFTYPTAGYFDSFVPALMNEVGGPDFFNKAMSFDVEAWKGEQATEMFNLVGKIAPYLQEDTVSNTNIKDGFKNNQQAVIDGKALFIPNGFWLPEEMKETTPEGFEWGFMALPAVKEGGDRYAFTFFEQCFIPKDAKEKDLAKEFVAFLYSDVAVKAFFENGGAVQPVKGAEEMITDPGNKEIYSIYADGAKAAMGGFVAVSPVEGVDMKAALYETINSVMSGAKTVEEWQAEVVGAAEKISAELQ